MSILSGACACGKTTFKLIASKDLFLRSAYCHCTNCSRINGAPFVWTTHFKFAAVTFDNWDQVVKWPQPQKPYKLKLRCPDCGSPLGTLNEKEQRWSIWPTTLERQQDGRIKGFEDFKATAHQFYGSSSIHLDDSLPKWSEYEGTSQRLS